MSANAPDFGPDFGPDDELDALLRQLRAQPAPAPRPFFYARVRARLDALETPNAPQPAPAALPWLLRRPAYALMLGILVLGLNIGAAVRYGRPRPAASVVAAPRHDAFVTEYQLDPFTVPLPLE